MKTLFLCGLFLAGASFLFLLTAQENPIQEQGIKNRAMVGIAIGGGIIAFSLIILWVGHTPTRDREEIQNYLFNNEPNRTFDPIHPTLEAEMRDFTQNNPVSNPRIPRPRLQEAFAEAEALNAQKEGDPQEPLPQHTTPKLSIRRNIQDPQQT
jgi:Co/Zn/Cd efflux system component